MDPSPQSPERRRKRTDLVHLRSLALDQPETATGQVLWMWPEIQHALLTGKTVREIWHAARLDGIDIEYPQFRVYVSRLRRRGQASGGLPRQDQQIQSAMLSEQASATRPKAPADPLYNLRVQLEKKRQSHFEYNPFPDPSD